MYVRAATTSSQHVADQNPGSLKLHRSSPAGNICPELPISGAPCRMLWLCLGCMRSTSMTLGRLGNNASHVGPRTGGFTVAPRAGGCSGTAQGRSLPSVSHHALLLAQQRLRLLGRLLRGVAHGRLLVRGARAQAEQQRHRAPRVCTSRQPQHWHGPQLAAYRALHAEVERCTAPHVCAANNQGIGAAPARCAGPCMHMLQSALSKQTRRKCLQRTDALLTQPRHNYLHERLQRADCTAACEQEGGSGAHWRGCPT